MYVVDFVRDRSVWFETLLHRPASSATRLAGSVHIPGRNVAKTVLVRIGDSFLLAVLPATSRIDLERLVQRSNQTDQSGWRRPMRSAGFSRTASRDQSRLSDVSMD